jgi:hypothetical protein
MMCSPVSSMMHCTMGSERARRLSPSTSLGRSDAILGSTATRTTGETENFMAFMGWASSQTSLVMVAVLMMKASRPTRATVLPQGTGGDGGMSVRGEGRRGRGEERVVWRQEGPRSRPGPKLTRLNGLLLAAHAQHGALHALDGQVLLLARHVVGAHDADLGGGGGR